MKGRSLPPELAARLDLLFRDFADPLYVWRRDGDFDFVLIAHNVAAEQVPHADVGVLLGQSAVTVYGDVLPQVVDDLRTAHENGALAREMDYSFVTSAARRRLLVSYTPLPPDIVVVSTRDVDELWRRAESSDQRARELEHLSEMTLALLEAGGPQEARELFCELTRTFTDADTVRMLEPRDDWLVQTAVSLGADVPEHEPLRVPLSGGSTWPERQVYESAQRMFIADVHSPLPVQLPPALRDTAVRSLLLEPVLERGRVLGVLGVGWRERRSAPPRRLLSLVRALATYAGSVIVRNDEVEDLTTLAGRDALTGLFNRRAWSEEMARALAQARRAGTPLCVAVLDVNGLKDVNDRHGHAAGDGFLRRASAAWRSELRQNDVLARLGGDEFAILIAGLTLREAREVVDRVAAADRDASVSTGVAQWDGEESAEALLARADAEMYRQKRERWPAGRR